MTGSLHVKNGKYYVTLNIKDELGKWKKKWIATGLEEKGNERRAKQILKKVLAEYESRPISFYEEILFVDYINIWLELAKIKVDEVTYQGYKQTADTHVIPYFKPLGLKLNGVTPQVLQQYINYKYEKGRLDGKGGLSGATIKHHMVVIQQTLKEALKKNMVLYNSAERVTLPKKEKFESGYYTAEQVFTMYEMMKDEPLLPLIKITAIYGLRRSELLGLKWDSINFDAGTVTIRHTISKCTTVVAKDKTKNAASRRSYPMLPELRDMLLAEKEKEKTNRRLFGKTYVENSYVFKWEDGRPYNPDFISRKFSSLLKKYSLPHIRFHDLRHSCASMLYELGYDLKDIKEWLGHADIKMTGNLYAHFNMRQKQGIADSFSASFQNAVKKAVQSETLPA